MLCPFCTQLLTGLAVPASCLLRRCSWEPALASSPIDAACEGHHRGLLDLLPLPATGDPANPAGCDGSDTLCKSLAGTEVVCWGLFTQAEGWTGGHSGLLGASIAAGRSSSYMQQKVNSHQTQRQVHGCPPFDCRDISPAACGPALGLLSKAQHRTAGCLGNSACPTLFPALGPGLTAGLISQTSLRVVRLQSWDRDPAPHSACCPFPLFPSPSAPVPPPALAPGCCR